MPRANNSKKPVVDNVDALERDLNQRADTCIEFLQKNKGSNPQKEERFEELRAILNEFYEYEDKGYSFDQAFIKKLKKFDSGKWTNSLKKSLGIPALIPLKKDDRKTDDAESDEGMSDNKQSGDLGNQFNVKTTREALDLLINAREEMGISQRDMADILGMAPASLCELEKKENPTSKSVAKYAEALGGDVGYSVSLPTLNSNPLED